MLTKLYPMVQFRPDTWEIDEFDCASMFLLIGTEKAMLIDTGMGIGDLRGAVEMITRKPLIVVLSHGHIDHTGNARQFEEVWIHRKDADSPMPDSLQRRRSDTEHIARRQKSSIGAPYTMFHLYPYDINVDLRDPSPDEKMPVIHELKDGMQFDLGGGRIVTAYECPGHTPGEMVFLDEKNRILFAGDALNHNLLAASMPAETTLRALKRIQAMSDRYDCIYNGHHDFRALGMPLDDDCLPTVIEILEDAVHGHLAPCQTPSFWGQDIPLTREISDMPAFPGMGKMITLRRGRCWVHINPDSILENGSSPS